MKNVIKKITFFNGLFLALVFETFAQTNVQGGIYANTIWSVANHPYIVTGQLTLFPNDTLFIEAGVTIKFEDTTGFEVRGALMALGTKNDPIKFTSNSSSPAKESWNGILVNNAQGGYAEFNHVEIEFASRAIQLSGLNSSIDMSKIKNTTFNSNHVGIAGSGYYDLFMDSCIFSYNMFGVWDARKVIENSFFHDNDYGLFDCQDIDLIGCTFCSNGIGIRSHRGEVVDCILMNNITGVDAYGNGFDVFTRNILAYNEVGMELTKSVDSGNVICNNKTFNVVNKTSSNLSVDGNCWCETDSTIIAQKIKDGYDDVSLGLIDFQNYKNCDSTAIPSNLDGKCYGQLIGVTDYQFDKNDLINIYPNPASSQIFFQILADKKTSGLIQVFNVQGNLMKVDRFNTYLIEVDIHSWPTGMYYYNVQLENGQILNGRFLRN